MRRNMISQRIVSGFCLGVLAVCMMCMTACGSGTENNTKTASEGAQAESATKEPAGEESSEPEATPDAEATPEPEDERADEGYFFDYKGVSVTMGDEAEPFVENAGKPKKKTAKKSCAFKGLDRTRTYPGFILYTYSESKKGEEYINGISFLADSECTTKEGVGIGSSLDQVTDAYGDAKPTGSGVYIFKKGKTKLMIQVADDTVKNIRYVMK